MNDVGERLVAAEIDLLGLERLHEALGLGVVVGVAPAAHRAAQPMRGEHPRDIAQQHTAILDPNGGCIPRRG